MQEQRPRKKKKGYKPDKSRRTYLRRKERLLEKERLLSSAWTRTAASADLPALPPLILLTEPTGSAANSTRADDFPAAESMPAADSMPAAKKIPAADAMPGALVQLQASLAELRAENGQA